MHTTVPCLTSPCDCMQEEKKWTTEGTGGIAARADVTVGLVVGPDSCRLWTTVPFAQCPLNKAVLCISAHFDSQTYCEVWMRSPTVWTILIVSWDRSSFRGCNKVACGWRAVLPPSPHHLLWHCQGFPGAPLLSGSTGAWSCPAKMITFLKKRLFVYLILCSAKMKLKALYAEFPRSLPSKHLVKPRPA